MSSQQSTVDSIVSHMSLAGEVRSRKMFGEYAIYCNDKVVAFVCDDKLFIKPTVTGRAFIGTPTEASAYPGSKNYFLMSEKQWTNTAWLTGLIREMIKELPAPKPKRSKTH